MTARVTADARRIYRDLGDDQVLERYAHQAVAELWTDAVRVTAFLPVLALRHVRDMLDASRRTDRQITAPTAKPPAKDRRRSSRHMDDDALTLDNDQLTVDDALTAG